MRKWHLLLFMVMCCTAAKAQQQDTGFRAFSEWHFRVNPFSFVEKPGGLHIGFETNLDNRKRFYLVSEYGYIFINTRKFNLISSEEEKDNRNPVRGFETKQELRKSLPGKKSTSFFAVELHYLNASVSNAGWFGMGTADANGNYPYVKYHQYKESMHSGSLAFKYVAKAFPQQDRWNIEFFAGLGLIYRDINNSGAEGKLLESDSNALFKEDLQGLKPYLALGFRISLKLK